jgi:hypothetical protein
LILVGIVQGTCPIHGLTDFYDDDPNLGGKRGKCVTCNSARTRANDKLRSDASLRLFGSRNYSTAGSDWYTQLTREERKQEIERQRLINASEDPEQVATIIQQIPDEIVEIENVLNEQKAEEDTPVEEETDEEVADEVEQEAKDTRGFIYIFRCESAWEGWVKAGEAARVSERLNTYQTYSPHRDYVLVASVYVNNRHAAEDKLHEELETHGQRDHEWFEVSIETAMAVIEEFREEFGEEE